MALGSSSSSRLPVFRQLFESISVLAADTQGQENPGVAYRAGKSDTPWKPLLRISGFGIRFGDGEIGSGFFPLTCVSLEFLRNAQLIAVGPNPDEIRLFSTKKYIYNSNVGVYSFFSFQLPLTPIRSCYAISPQAQRLEALEIFC
jgi:hypothetical protein